MHVVAIGAANMIRKENAATQATLGGIGSTIRQQATKIEAPRMPYIFLTGPFQVIINMPPTKVPKPAILWINPKSVVLPKERISGKINT